MGDRLKFDTKKKSKKFDIKKMINFITPEPIKIRIAAKASNMTPGEMRQWIKDKKEGNSSTDKHMRQQQKEFRRASLVREIYGDRHSVSSNPFRLSEIQREVRANLDRVM